MRCSFLYINANLKVSQFIHGEFIYTWRLVAAYTYYYKFSSVQHCIPSSMKSQTKPTGTMIEKSSDQFSLGYEPI